MSSSGRFSDRFHRAAKDGNLDILESATNKDANTRDEDGMTATNYAAFYGNLAALRKIIGRGGNVDKCDYLGNTPLHHAAARGHLDCVSYLINFGSNIFAMDNDRRTAMNLASLHDRLDIVRILDEACAKQLRADPKRSRRLQESAVLEADARKKEFEKRQRSVQKKLEKQNPVESTTAPKSKSFYKTITAKLIPSSSKENGRRIVTETGKKAVVNDRDQAVYVERDADSVRTFRTDDSGFYGEEGTAGRFPMNGFKGMNRAILKKVAPIQAESLYGLSSRGAEVISEEEDENAHRSGNVSVMDSVGSAGSFAHRNKHDSDGDGVILSDDEDDDEDADDLQLFLASNHLLSHYALLQKEDVKDVETLLLLSESELEKIGFQLGPRKRLMQAILKRKMDLEGPSDIIEAHL